jgi:hypothetical protein
MPTEGWTLLPDVIVIGWRCGQNRARTRREAEDSAPRQRRREGAIKKATEPILVLLMAAQPLSRGAAGRR